MYQTSESQILLGIIVLSAVFAWWKGGRPERVGALFNGVVAIGITLLQGLTHEALGTVPILIADGVLAVGFLILAVRYATLWLGAAMLLQGVAFSMHAALQLGVLPPGKGYYAAMNAMSAGVLLSIILGTAYAWVVRRRAARLAAGD